MNLATGGVIALLGWICIEGQIVHNTHITTNVPC